MLYLDYEQMASPLARSYCSTMFVGSAMFKASIFEDLFSDDVVTDCVPN